MIDFNEQTNGAGQKRTAAPSNDEPDPPYIIESATEIAEPNPPLEWLCRGLRLARGSITIVGGYGYSRKTLYAQAMALAVASGRRVLDLYSVDHQPALHIDYEQGKRITRERYQRLARAGGIELQKTLLSVVTFPRFKLSSPEARDQLRRLLEETGAKLVILDSLRASVSGVEENSSEIREYIDVVGTECKRVDAAAMIIHHARKPSDGKPGGKYSLRGSGAIFDACDGVFIFSGEKGQPTTVEHEKDRLMGTELDAFGLNSEDVAHGNEPRWGLRLVHQEAQQLRQAEDARRAATVAAKRAAKDTEREVTETERAAKDSSKRERREAEAKAKRDDRLADEDAALRDCVAADPGINEGRLLSAMRARLGACSEPATRTAIERARQAGWLEVRPGAKNAKLHHVKASPS